ITSGSGSSGWAGSFETGGKSAAAAAAATANAARKGRVRRMGDAPGWWRQEGPDGSITRGGPHSDTWRGPLGHSLLLDATHGGQAGSSMWDRKARLQKYS